MFHIVCQLQPKFNGECPAQFPAADLMQLALAHANRLAKFGA
jgi:hypothetical protein